MIYREMLSVGESDMARRCVAGSAGPGAGCAKKLMKGLMSDDFFASFLSKRNEGKDHSLISLYFDRPSVTRGAGQFLWNTHDKEVQLSSTLS